MDERRDEAAIARLYQGWFSALERGDVDSLLALVTDDVLVKGPAAPPTRGRDELGARLRALFERYQERCEYELEEVGVAGTWAYALVRERTTIVARDGSGERTVLSTHLAILSRQVDGGWKVARDVSSLDEPHEA